MRPFEDRVPALAAAGAVPVADPALRPMGMTTAVPRGQAVAESQRKPAIIKAGDGMILQISMGDFVKVVGLIVLVAAAYWGIVSELRDIKRVQADQGKDFEEVRTQLQAFDTKFDGKWLMQQYDLYDIKIALARAGLWTGPISPPPGAGGVTVTIPQQSAPKPPNDPSTASKPGDQ